MRSSSSPYTNPSGLVDKRLAPMWEQIEQVRELLPQIAHVSYYMESIFNLDRNLSLLEDENVSHHILKDITIFQGANAYETAVAEGYVGDVTSWLASLKGDKGDQGDPGVIDSATLTQLQTDIQQNTDDLDTLEGQVTGLAGNLSDYTLTSAFTSYQTTVTQDLAALNTALTQAIADAVDPLPTTTDMQSIADTQFNTLIQARDTALDSHNARLDAADALLLGLRGDVDAQATAYSSFLTQNATDVSRITVLESASSDHSNSIVAIETANVAFAATQTLLQAETATNASDISNLQVVTSDSATQINILQTTTGDNSASVTTLAQTMTDLENNLTGRLGFIVQAGNELALFDLWAGTAFGSIATLTADKFLINGDVIVNGTLLQGAFDDTERNSLVALGNAANFYQQSSQPGVAVPNGATWFNNDNDGYYVKVGGAWLKTSDLTAEVIAAGQAGLGDLALANNASTRNYLVLNNTAIRSNSSGYVLGTITIDTEGENVEVEVSFEAAYDIPGSGNSMQGPNPIMLWVERNGSNFTGEHEFCRIDADNSVSDSNTMKFTDFASLGSPGSPVAASYVVKAYHKDLSGLGTVPSDLAFIKVNTAKNAYMRTTQYPADANIIA